MAGFTDPFGGGVLKPAQVSYREFDLTENMVTMWPAFATDDNVLAQTMRIMSATAGLSIALPDATQASPGEQVTFYNDAANPVAIVNALGGAVATIDPGARRLIELRSAASASGSWLSTLLGVGTGSLDVAAAAGAGLMAVGTQLQVALQVEYIAASRAITEADRDKVLIWNGGAGTLTLPDSTTLQRFNFEIRNQGTGAVVLSATGGQQIDGSATAIFNSTESAWVHAAPLGGWHTVGRGRNAQFNFTLLQKTVDGGSDALTLTEAANVIQTYSGTLVSNQEVILPAIVQVYYVSNQTTGAFNLLFRNPGLGGGSVSIPQGQNAILVSDGVNVINAATTVAGIGAITFAAGSAASPSVQIGAVNTGFFSPSSGQVAFSSGGSQVFTMQSNGVVASTSGNTNVTVASTGAVAFFVAQRPAGTYGGVQVQTGTSPRLYFGSDNSAESGGNAGSNLIVQTYDDSGAALYTPLRISRAPGTVSAVALTDTGANGCNIKMTGDGGVTPSKFVRVQGGNFQIVNNAYSAPILSLTDAGALSIPAGFSATTGAFSSNLNASGTLAIGGTASMGSLTVTGNITASGNVAAYSDERLKSDIRRINGALARLRQTMPATYFKEGLFSRGYIAQRMQPVYPELVVQAGEFLSFNYMGMVAELHAAILELDARINRPNAAVRMWRWVKALFA